ncbi:MAG TPA: Gfo/Idh/MocA family oxidoreductase [bacterium]|nr:Gfo/Idh/MocA family oxidoreductase [bacterium]
MPRMRVGVAGCGDVAQHTYLPGLARLTRDGCLDLAAVADPVAGRAAEMAQRHGVPRAYPSVEDLLGADVDLVVNLTPMPVHAQVTLSALAAGKHVYTEKPIATRLEDADAIIDAAARAGVTVAAAPALLVHPDIRQSQQWLDAGVIGKICFARARASNPGPDRIPDFLTDPTWFHKAGAGPLYDLGVYPLHVLTGALGPVRRVTAFSGVAIPRRVVAHGPARGRAIDVEVDDNTHLLLDFGDAAFAYVDATYCVLSSKGPRIEFYGETGVMNLASTPDEPPIEVYRTDAGSGLRGSTTPEPVYRGRVNPPRRRPDPPPYTLVSGVEHLVEHLERGTPLLLTAAHARHVLEITLAVQRSAREGRVVDLRTTFERPRREAPRTGTDGPP